MPLTNIFRGKIEEIIHSNSAGAQNIFIRIHKIYIYTV